MTIDPPQTFSVKSVAIIGAGPSGIASLHDLSRVTRSGKSLFGERDISKYEKEGDLAFPDLVAFERNASVGGVWSKSAFAENNRDPNLPEFKDDSVDLTNPENVYQKIPIDAGLEKKLGDSSVDHPVKVLVTPEISTKIQHQWRSSAAYNGLFTNVTNRYMSFSFDERIGDDLKKINSKYKHIPDHQSSRDVSDYLERVVANNNLEKYIRFNTNVERVKKLPSGKWEVVASHLAEENGVQYLHWYKQIFDAVIIGNGKTVPIVPNIKNMAKFAEVNKDKVTFKLAKSVQDPSFIRNAKKPLFIGSSVSSVDLIQYAFPRDLEKPSVYISRRTETANSGWVTFCSYAKGVVNKPTIEEFLPESNSVRFSDGTVESGFDAIIVCTGYHMFYPFIDKSVVDSNPNIFKFFRYTFSMADPTLALVGNTYAGFFFNRVESQAAALAGVWTNQSKLPSLKEQEQEYEQRPKLLVVPIIDKWFISPLISLAIKGRPHPFTVNKEKSDYIYHVATGGHTILGLFFKVRNGEVDSRDLLAT